MQDLRENAESMHFYADELLEDVNNLLNMQLALAAHRTNEVVQVLTVFSAFFLPLTFIVGVYGMNFEHMPELPHRLGYPAVWVVMIAVSLAIWVLVPAAGVAVMRRSVWLLGGMRGRGGAGAALAPPGRWRRPGRVGWTRPWLPDPALRWLAEARQALGVWVASSPLGRGARPSPLAPGHAREAGSARRRAEPVEERLARAPDRRRPRARSGWMPAPCSMPRPAG